MKTAVDLRMAPAVVPDAGAFRSTGVSCITLSTAVGGLDDRPRGLVVDPPWSSTKGAARRPVVDRRRREGIAPLHDRQAKTVFLEIRLANGQCRVCHDPKTDEDTNQVTNVPAAEPSSSSLSSFEDDEWCDEPLPPMQWRNVSALIVATYTAADLVRDVRKSKFRRPTPSTLTRPTVGVRPEDLPLLTVDRVDLAIIITDV